MAMIRSFTVGNGDMFYIKHNTDNLTTIDCQLFGDHKEWLVDEFIQESKNKGITRFISTHPDEDHLQGIEHLDERMPIQNFYVVKNDANKPDESESFKHYKKLRDGDKAFMFIKPTVSVTDSPMKTGKMKISGFEILTITLARSIFNNEAGGHLNCPS